MCGQVEESIGLNNKRRDVEVCREEMAMQRHTDGNGLPEKEYMIPLKVQLRVISAEFGMRLPQV